MFAHSTSGSGDDIEDEDLIADEDMVVTVTNTGLIKRMSPDEYRTQKTRRQGVKGMETKRRRLRHRPLHREHKKPCCWFSLIKVKCIG